MDLVTIPLFYHVSKTKASFEEFAEIKHLIWIQVRVYVSILKFTLFGSILDNCGSNKGYVD